MGLSAQQQYYLQKMGIDIYVPRQQPVVTEFVPVAEIHRVEKASASIPAANWEKLRNQVAGCTLCDLHKSRTRTVFGVGDVNADWMIIGEAPGRDEDLQGEPFVGRAGKLLNSMLFAIGLKREQVFIANILKCRPPNNRDPRPEEVACCESYLRQQIVMIKPRIILAVGRIAAQNLLKVDTPIGRMRGNRYDFPGSEIPVVVTYHPAYLLRSPREKRKVWQDLTMAMEIYRSS